jgi:hypothetical protein
VLKNVLDPPHLTLYIETVKKRFLISYQLSAISYQLSVISYQLSVISYQLSVISYQLTEVGVNMSLGGKEWFPRTLDFLSKPSEGGRDEKEESIDTDCDMAGLRRLFSGCGQPGLQ